MQSIFRLFTACHCALGSVISFRLGSTKWSKEKFFFSLIFWILYETWNSCYLWFENAYQFYGKLQIWCTYGKSPVTGPYWNLPSCTQCTTLISCTNILIWLHFFILLHYRIVFLYTRHHHQFLLLFVADHIVAVKRFHPFLLLVTLFISLQVSCFKPNVNDKRSIWFPLTALSQVGYFTMCRWLAYSFWGLKLSFIPKPLTLLVWVTLPGAEVPAGIALVITGITEHIEVRAHRENLKPRGIL